MKLFSEPWMGNCKRENEKPIYDSRSVLDRLLLCLCIGAVRLQENGMQNKKAGTMFQPELSIGDA